MIEMKFCILLSTHVLIFNLIPDMERRDLSHKEKLYLREQNVITETQCTLGKILIIQSFSLPFLLLSWICLTEKKCCKINNRWLLSYPEINWLIVSYWDDLLFQHSDLINNLLNSFSALMCSLMWCNNNSINNS